MALEDLRDPFSTENIDHTPIEPIEWSLPKSNLTPIEAATEPQRTLRSKREDLEKLAEEAREREFDKFNQSSPNTGPYILTRPDSDRLNIPRGTRMVPGRKALEDQIAQRKYFLSPKGIIFNSTEAAKQSRNMRRLTRFYNPNALLESSFHVLINKKRHMDSSDVMGRALNSFSRFAGVSESIVPQSASLSREVENITGIDSSGRPWGYNFFQSPSIGSGATPGPSISPTNIVGHKYRNILRKNLAARASMVSPDKYSLLPSGPVKLAKRKQEILNGATDYFLGMKEFKGSDGRYRFDLYNSTAPYVSDTSILNEAGEVGAGYETPSGKKNINNITGVNDASPISGQPEESYLPLLNKTLRDAERAREAPAEFRLGGETPYPDWDELPSNEYENSSSEEKEKFYQHQFIKASTPEAEYVVKHRQKNRDIVTAGLPNYSAPAESEESIDAINSLPIQNWDGSEEANIEVDNDSDELVRDMIIFRFYDVANNKRILFRSYISGINFSNSINWSSTQYAGRPEQYHVYGGNSRQVNFSFVVYPESEFTFKRVWQKINYLEGLSYPSKYTQLGDDNAGGAFMTPPFMRLSIGDLLRQTPGFFQSFDISIPDESTWETKPGMQLPKYVELQCSYTIIENKSPKTGDSFFSANFLNS